MARSFNDVNFASEISKRTIKNSLSVGLFSKSAESFTVKYTGSNGEEIESTYLAIKMISVEKESLWLGYKVKEIVGGEKVEIDITKLLWIYIDSTILKKQIRVNELEEYSVAEILRDGNKELPIKIGDNAKNIDYHTRCISQLNNSINDIYSKARVHSFLKMLTHFAMYEYDFLKSEYADESNHQEDQFVLKSRYVPLIIQADKGRTVNSVSIYINSLKDGTKHVGLWLCAPLNESGFVDLDQVVFVAGLASKNISVNSTAALANQIEVKHFSKELIASKDNNEDLEKWLSSIFTKFGVSKFVANSNVSDFIEKLEKSKDLLSEEIVESIYFTNIESFKDNTIKLTDTQAKELKQVKKTKAKAVEAEQPAQEEVEEAKVEEPQIQANEQSKDKIVTEQAVVEEDEPVEEVKPTDTVEETVEETAKQEEVTKKSVEETPVVDTSTVNVSEILQESIDEDGYWSFNLVNSELIEFKHTLLHCQISFDVEQMKQQPNKIFNEMLLLSIDPYTVKESFEKVGHKFKEYGYAQVRKLISEVPDEVLNRYIDLENYYDLVETEKYNRSIEKG